MQKTTHPETEQEILKFWQDNNTFQKTLAKKSPNGDYVFYDGPPFATGTPHYGHLVASIMKDVVPRYWTMKGYHVERKWGWDCHGLPIENIVEKELKTKSKKDIEKMGVEKFNACCRSKVLEYAEAWKKTITRLGRWADMSAKGGSASGGEKGAYKTMDLSYMESIWWVFKELWDKDLIYEGYKSMHICPRCETTLSQYEVAEGYKNIKDISVIAKFELVDEPGTYLLAWTTTPWTLIGNVALAVGEDIKYLKVKSGKEDYIIAKEKIELIKSPEIYKEFSGKELIGKKYKPLFDYYLGSDLENKKNLYTIQPASFVTTEEGTGIVHIAPAFGEDDMNLGKEKKLPFIQHVNMDGTFKAEVKGFEGDYVKPTNDPKATDIKIVEHLKNRNLIFSEQEYSHSYPHCWRCETPLLNYATSSYFVNVTKLKPKLLKNAKTINWSPSHIKEGRFGKWLEGARDWSISRQRFWATAIPVWRCSKCDEVKVFGSIKDLEKESGKKITDLHKDVMDKIEFKCKCKAVMKRIPDVLDCWFESGSMPYAQEHYPFENKKRFEANFPAQFIAEGSDHTRAWFYYLHVVATALFNKPAYKNVIVNGIVLAEDGKKMSKRLKNYPEPDIVMEKYGSDAVRFYLLSSPVMATENINFTETLVKESYQKVVMLLSNILSFYQMYAGDKVKIEPPTHVLDKWILTKLNLLVHEVTKQMDSYDLVRSVRPIQDFINELSTWYIRRSRDRFKSNDKNTQLAVSTLGHVLLTLGKLMAPFTPFIAEHIYQTINYPTLAKGGNGRGGLTEESVHLENWPKPNEKLIDKNLLTQMDLVRTIASQGLEKRATEKIPVRQPLAMITVTGAELKNPELEDLLKDELNIIHIEWKGEKGDLAVELDTKLTPELEALGIARELTRHINSLRKEKGLTIKDRINITYQTQSQKIKQAIESEKSQILKDTLADRIEVGGGEKGVKVKGEVVKIQII